MSREKKKFRDTAVGKLFREKLPEGIAVIGDLLPDKGVLGVAKNIIDKSTLSAEEKLELHNELKDYRLELHKLEIEDRANARWREVEMAKVGKSDFLKTLAGLVALGLFILVVVAVIFGEKWGLKLMENPMVHQIIGLIEGVAISVFSYYFGTSKSSQDKTKMDSLK